MPTPGSLAQLIQTSAQVRLTKWLKRAMKLRARARQQAR
jgi:hypothetical protein